MYFFSPPATITLDPFTTFISFFRVFLQVHLKIHICRRMKLKKEIQAIKELNEQEKQAQAAKAAAAQVGQTKIKLAT